MTTGKPIIFKQAPCRPDGQIIEGTEENREGTCYCSLRPRTAFGQGGCCVGKNGVILPRTLKPEYAKLNDKELNQLIKSYGIER